MSEKKPIQMRRVVGASDARRRAVVLAGAVGAIALVVAIGALVVGTFPRPSSSGSSPASRPTAASSVSRSVASSATVARASAPAKAPVPAKPATPVAKKVAKKAVKTPAAKKLAPIVLPLGMSRVLPGSKQLIVATGPKLGATHGTLRIFNLDAGGWKQVFSAACRFGTNGLIDGAKRKEGSRTTPTGIWWPGAWVWGWHKSAPAGTLMPYRPTTASVWWSDERNSTYNTWVVSAKRVSGEHLVDVRIQYEFALSTGYNSPPNNVVRGRGTAIFLHVFDPPDYHNGLSAGCVALSRVDLIRVFQTMDPKLTPCFAMGTDTPGTATSIASY
jgi:L,D-peptidoglycan transpeptidase YkuD (ErfK/YbiS/YcfS/YnhG family)